MQFREQIISVLLHGLSQFSLQRIHQIADILSRIFLKMRRNRATRTIDKNIQQCFPELSASQRAQFVTECVQQTSRCFAELSALWLWKPQKIQALVKNVSGLEHLDQAMTLGKGVILLTPHLGAWEMAGLFASSRYPITSLYRPPKMQGLEGLVKAGRESMGARLVPTDAAGVKALFQALQRGEIAGILPDHEPSRGMGVFAPFFGIPAYTMVLVPRLARKTGASVVFTFAERLPNAQGFHLHFLPADPAVSDADLNIAAQALNAGVERCVRTCPSQYQWGYKRFKSRPDQEANFYS
jgi:KDO2-lipid IV(A) lauroyltransferase